MIRILLLEDEIPAFEKLRSYLTLYFKNGFHYDWGRSVSEAKHFLTSETKYAFIISDIKLLDGHVFDVYDNLDLKIPIIFCSAYDEYLFKAFKTNGIAYILKPYTQEDIAAALDKHQILFSNTLKGISVDVLRQLKETVQSEQVYKEQFVIKTKKGIHLLETAAISCIEAQGDFCKLIDHKGKTHLYSQSIGLIYAQLDPKVFFRINRSAVVQLPFIEKIDNYFKNRLKLSITGLKNQVITSSSTTADFRRWLDR